MSDEVLDVRVVERVVEPEEWVRYDADRVFEVATWLAERGLRPEVRFNNGATPELWYFAGSGMSRPEPGQWLRVVNGASLHTRTDAQLDNPDRYLPAGSQQRGAEAAR